MSQSFAALPTPDVYELEYKYWPWGALLDAARDIVLAITPQQGDVFDYMCGTGLLLRKITKIRPDICVSGCDSDASFVKFANSHQARGSVKHVDVRTLSICHQKTVVLCTGGLHHLNFEEQSDFLARVAAGCDQHCNFIWGEEAIPEYSTEKERRRSALELNAALIAYALERDCPASLIDAAIEVLRNDILLRGEFKRSLADWQKAIGAHFTITQTKTTWQPQVGGGDVLFLCKAKS
jgi:SAM-dependent methyltransferase